MADCIKTDQVCVFGDKSELLYLPDGGLYVWQRPDKEQFGFTERILQADNAAQAINEIQGLMIEEIKSRSFADSLAVR